MFLKILHECGLKLCMLVASCMLYAMCDVQYALEFFSLKRPTAGFSFDEYFSERISRYIFIYLLKSNPLSTPLEVVTAHCHLTG